MVFRKAILMGVALLLTGIMPVVAAITCVDLPCCHHKGTVVAQPNTSDCCTPVTCVEESKAVKNASPSPSALKLIAVVIAPVILPVPIETVPVSILAASPPSTSKRLSTLSVLLI